MTVRMSDQEWGVLSTYVRGLAYGQGERAARSFVRLAEAPQEVEA
jgi:hypothetical protein